MAIAFDNFTDNGNTTASSVTFSYTVGSGSNRFLVVAVTIANATDSVTGVTYNGVAMTQSLNYNPRPGIRAYLYTLVAPATGANNVVVSLSASENLDVWAASYTGVRQSSTVESTGTNNADSVTSITATLNPVTPGSWSAVIGMNFDANSLGGTNNTPRDAASGYRYGDSNGSLGAAGAKTIENTSSAANRMAIAGLSFAPVLDGINFDAVTTGSTTGTSLTTSHTCTGSDRILMVGVTSNNGASNFVTGVTYGGVAMTLIGERRKGDNERWLSLWYLIAPATGANNIVVSASSSTFLLADGVSYTGVKQSGQPDASATNIATNATTFNTSLTSIADNCWHVMYAGNALGTHTAGTGTTIRGTGAASNMCDSNSAKTPAGSATLQLTYGSVNDWGSIIATIAPTATSTFIPRIMMS